MKRVIFAILVFVLLLSMLGCKAPQTAPAIVPEPETVVKEQPTMPEEEPDQEEIHGTPRAPFHYETVDLEGNVVDIKAFTADYDLTVVNFFATWCGPCVQELPYLEAMHVAFEGAEEDFPKIGVTGVWLDTESREDLDLVLEAAGVTYPVWEFQPEMMDRVDLSAVPVTIFLDRDGLFVGAPAVGARDLEGWAELVSQRLAAVQTIYELQEKQKTEG